MDTLGAGGLILALISIVYAIQLGLQINKMKKKIAELEEMERKALEQRKG
jgi:Na+-translocating ferredoxin:NAD+ oxidoreductase RnfG subunit